MHYGRALCPRYTGLLGPAGPFEALIPFLKSFSDRDPFALDVQLRGRFGLYLYHGWRMLASMAFDVEQEAIVLRHDRRREYFSSSQADLMLSRLAGYLPEAIDNCAPAYYAKRGEGYWLNCISLSLGQNWQAGQDWLVVDRDAGFDVTLAQLIQCVDPIRLKYEAIRRRLQAEDPKTWGPPGDNGFGHEGRCDLVALGPEGELLCIEVVCTADGDQFHWGLLEAAVAAEVFHQSRECLAEGILKLIEQKVELGLLPEAAIRRIPKGGFRHVRPVLLVAGADNQSPSWKLVEQLAALINHQGVYDCVIRLGRSGSGFE